jgi:membrane associated rhomboid family serine protease
MIPIRDHLPTRRVPFVNYALVLANIAVYMWERLIIAEGVRPTRLLMALGLVPARFTADPLADGVHVFTSMFMHDPSSLAHIGGNLLFLWIFGDNVEDAMGHARYAAFYLLGGIAAAMAQVVIGPHSAVPMVGASGAIAAVLAAYASLYPRSPITILNPFLPLWFFFGLFFELPAWIVIGEFFLINLWNALGSIGGASASVAFFAHLGGFVAGLFLVRLFVREVRPRQHEHWSGWQPPAARRGPWARRPAARHDRF